MFKKMIKIFERYVTQKEKVEKLVSAKKIEIEKLNKHICNFFVKFGYDNNIKIDKEIEDMKYSTKGHYTIITDFISKKNKLNSFSIEIAVNWGYNVLIYLKIKRGTQVSNPTNKFGTIEDIENNFVNDIFYFFNTFEGVTPFFWSDFDKQKWKLEYEIIDVDKIISQLSKNDFDAKINSRKYNI